MTWTNREKHTWAACAIDGEGSIKCVHGVRNQANGNKPYWFIHVDVSNTDPRFVLKMREIFNDGHIATKRPGTKSERPVYTWSVASRRAVLVLETVMPYLVIKREQAEVALAIAATIHRKGLPATWTGSNRGGGRKQLKPEIVAKRVALAQQLRDLKHVVIPLKEAM